MELFIAETLNFKILHKYRKQQKIKRQKIPLLTIYIEYKPNNQSDKKGNIYLMKILNIETKAVNPLIGDIIPLPSYATEGSAAIDLRACIRAEIEIHPGETALIGSGIAINIKDSNVVGIIAPRSGLGIKKGIVLANTIGVIDSDYQGEIKIGLFNRGKTTYIVKPGERICQMLFMPVIKAILNLVQSFSNETVRGQGGFGHSGKI